MCPDLRRQFHLAGFVLSLLMKSQLTEKRKLFGVVEAAGGVKVLPDLLSAQAALEA